MEYDIIMIGGGPGGYVCAIRAAQLGKKVAVVEEEFMGGVCLNIGCIPSKALLKNAELAHTLRERGGEFGFEVQGLKLDYGQAVKRSRQVSKRLVNGVEFLMRKNKIDVHRGHGRIAGAGKVIVKEEPGETELTAPDIVIATGAKPAMIPGVEADGERVLTYREAILQEKLPKSVVIVGAGPVGLEFGTIWHSYGADVTIVEMLPRIAPLEDEEVSKELRKQFERRGIQVRTGSRVVGVETLKTKVKVAIEADGEQESLNADQALVAIGFKPNTEGLGLEQAGVERDNRGFVGIDSRLATNVEGFWAIGDVTGKAMLAHVASAMGIVCAENIGGVETIELDYKMMPRGIFCRPQVASFGLTKEEAEEQGFDVKIGRFPFQANGKALGLGDYAGWVKLVVDSRYGEILGGHLIGPEVTELLPELTLSQMMELTPAEIARNVHMHPTLSEALGEAAHDAEGHAINI
jgi:dihydrolipoamide dehydrogenase